MWWEVEKWWDNIKRARSLISLTQKILDEIEEVKVNVEAILSTLDLDNITVEKSLASILKEKDYSKKEIEMIASILIAKERNKNIDINDLISLYYDISHNIYKKLQSLADLLNQEQIVEFPEEIKEIILEIWNLFSELIPIWFLIQSRLKTIININFSFIDINKIKDVLGWINQKLAFRTTQIIDIQKVIEDLIKNNEISKLVSLVELIEKWWTFNEFTNFEQITIENPNKVEKIILAPDKQEAIRNRVIEKEMVTIELEIDWYNFWEKVKMYVDLARIWYYMDPWFDFSLVKETYIRRLAERRIQKRNK